MTVFGCVQGVCKERKALFRQASVEVAKLEKEVEKAQKPTKLKKAQLKNLKTQVLISVVHAIGNLLYMHVNVLFNCHNV